MQNMIQTQKTVLYELVDLIVGRWFVHQYANRKVPNYIKIYDIEVYGQTANFKGFKAITIYPPTHNIKFSSIYDIEKLSKLTPVSEELVPDSVKIEITKFLLRN